MGCACGRSVSSHRGGVGQKGQHTDETTHRRRDMMLIATWVCSHFCLQVQVAFKKCVAHRGCLASLRLLRRGMPFCYRSAAFFKKRHMMVCVSFSDPSAVADQLSDPSPHPFVCLLASSRWKVPGVELLCNKCPCTHEFLRRTTRRTFGGWHRYEMFCRRGHAGRTLHLLRQ